MSPVVRISLAAVVLYSLCGISGCGSPETSEPSEESGASTSYESPQAVFDAAKAAMEADQYDRFLACLTAESQDVLVFGLTFAGQMAKAFSGLGGALGGELGAAAGAEGEGAEGENVQAEIEQKFGPLDAVFEKHGVTEEAFGESDEPMDPRAAAKELASKINDKPTYVSELLAALDAISDGEARGPQALFQAELSDIQVDGDTAVAMATNPDNPQQTGPVHFQRVDGGWLIDLSHELGGPPAS